MKEFTTLTVWIWWPGLILRAYPPWITAMVMPMKKNIFPCCMLWQKKAEFHFKNLRQDHKIQLLYDTHTQCQTQWYQYLTVLIKQITFVQELIVKFKSYIILGAATLYFNLCPLWLFMIYNKFAKTSLFLMQINLKDVTTSWVTSHGLS